MVNTRGTSPTQSGPAGSLAEGQVGGFYLLPLLTGAPARGLKGVTLQKVAYQQANLEYPLDDVVLTGIDASGAQVTLEIQVKLSISFTPTDPVFKKVVGQIVASSQHMDFQDTRHQFAIAIAKTTTKIERAYQDLLVMARRSECTEDFFRHVRLAGVINQDARTFVDTFTQHCDQAGFRTDDESIWELLRRLQILVFDFAADGSATEELVVDRIRHVLDPEDIAKAPGFWGNLIQLSLDYARAAGALTKETLIQQIGEWGYSLQGAEHYGPALNILAESSDSVLADIYDKVGGINLPRRHLLDAVRDALSRGRYVEIRGAAGVGKSALLKHLGLQMCQEGRVIAFNPDRCTPRGGAALRAEIGFQGTLRELLVEVALSGGATILIDDLYFYSRESRATIADFMRAAVDVSGVSIVVTTRSDIVEPETAWLPDECLDQLGKAAPIEISDLDDDEVAQLAEANTGLQKLLAADHPARDVTHNLFRLHRLTYRATDLETPRTELEMALQWWQSADGERDEGHRGRARLLRALAEQVLAQNYPLDVIGFASDPIEALIRSGTLRDLGSDHVSFRHDVFRDWAIACALYSDRSLLDRLNLATAIPPEQSRGIELTASMVLAQYDDAGQWRDLLARLSEGGAHSAWRRTGIIAPLRSDDSSGEIVKLTPELLADYGALLSEVLRLIMAVDVMPASDLLSLDPSVTAIPGSIMLPSSPSWSLLTNWILAISDHLPLRAIPDVVEFLSDLQTKTFGHSSLAPGMAELLFQWLSEMEFRSARYPGEDETRFWHGREPREVEAIKLNLRSAFICGCIHIPDKAQQLLSAVLEQDNAEKAFEYVLLPGSLTRAAPDQLAELTLQSLISSEEPDEFSYERRGRRDAFSYLDYRLYPPRPTRGPFWGLLCGAPDTGLRLVRDVVDHAIHWRSNGQSPGDNGFTIAVDGKLRQFPWIQSYRWSRESESASLTSALMALEAWGHQRIENGDDVETVLKDILGPEGSPAAYVLVAVDLIISHWPKTVDVAVPFLSNPWLLAHDYNRPTQDEVSYHPGFKQTNKPGIDLVEDLSTRPSRQYALTHLLRFYIRDAYASQQGEIIAALEASKLELGPPGLSDDLGSPALVASWARNQLNPENWQTVCLRNEEGTEFDGREYISPADEDEHFANLRAGYSTQMEEFAITTAIAAALSDPEKLPVEQHTRAFEWAEAASQETSVSDGDEEFLKKQAIPEAAMILMRDGSEEDRRRFGGWARGVYARAFAAEEDHVHVIRDGLKFNPKALAYLGLIHAWAHQPNEADVRQVLDTVAMGAHSAVHALGPALDILIRVDKRLIPAILRCGLNGCIAYWNPYDIPESVLETQRVEKQRHAGNIVDAEIDWLAGGGSEPAWPDFPSEKIRVKKSIRFGRDEVVPEPRVPQSHEYAQHQVAAKWIQQVAGLSAEEYPWLIDLVDQYLPWTLEASGAGLETVEEVESGPMEWNHQFFKMAVQCMDIEPSFDFKQEVLESLFKVHDRNFYDLATTILHNIDEQSLGCDVLDASTAVDIRTAVANRVISTREWDDLRGERRLSVTLHFSPVVAALFFGRHDTVRGETECYLTPIGVDRIEPYVPLLTRLAADAPSLFVARLVCALLEVKPGENLLGLLVPAANSWFLAYPDFRPFWIDYSIGVRLARILTFIFEQSPSALMPGQPFFADISEILAKLISLGVAEASQLEELIAQTMDSS